MELFPVGRVFDFLGKRRYFIALSLIIVTVSLVSLVWPGPKLGTDFRGGTEIEVAFTQPTNSGDVRKAVIASGFAQPDVVKVDDANNPYRYLIRVQEISTIDEAKQAEIERALCFGEDLPAAECSAEHAATEVKFSPGGDKVSVRFGGAPDLAWVRQRIGKVSGITLRAGENDISVQSSRENRVEIALQSRGDQLMDGLRQRLGPERVPASALRVEWIGPKAGAQLRNSAFVSVVLSIVFIGAYIAFRFDLRFAPGAVLSLLHDAIGLIGIWILLGKEINLATIASVLTVVGYSINDTVVVYDRVRENLGKMRAVSFDKLINTSLSEMLSRTVLTSGTTVMSLLAFFLWGTGVLKDFALSLIIGIVLGTYSSIYVSLPITEWFDKHLFAKRAAKKPRRAAAKRASAST